jgi:excisionase family DNA binding protein
MGQTIDREYEKMWDSVETLAGIDKEQATVVFKLAVERPFREMDSFTPAISTIPLSLPNHEALLELKMLHGKIKEALKKQDQEKAYEFLVDYIDLLSQITGQDSQQVRKQLFSSIMAQKRRRRFQHTPKSGHLTRPHKSEDTSLFYSTSEAARKLGLSDQTIRRMCEKEKFPTAYKTDGGHWRIPKTAFITTDEQDERANRILAKIDAKNQAAGYVDEFDL